VRDTDLLRAIGQAREHAVQTHAIWCELDEIRQRLGRLTPRERKVMVLVVTGRLDKQVTAELGTVEKTTKAHRARVMAKMEVASLAELSASQTRPVSVVLPKHTHRVSQQQSGAHGSPCRRTLRFPVPTRDQGPIAAFPPAS
jgi:DNA-binding CsgD family transcriptional regulator